MTIPSHTKRIRIPATFYRGGTSKAVVFKDSDLPADRAARDHIFLHVLGSPDPYKRQLDGMGGGISSLSKVVIVGPSTREDADVDYTFVQIAVEDAVADYGSMCGNMSSMVGPFAVDEGMVSVPHAPDGQEGPTEVTVRIYNTNTDKLFNARFMVEDGLAVEGGDFEIPGVAQTGAKIKIDAMDPGGSKTGKLLPTGNPVDTLTVNVEAPDRTESSNPAETINRIEASLIDAANPVVYVRAEDVGKTGMESPQDLDADTAFMAKIDAIRRAGGVAMGMADTPEAVALSNPKVAIVARPDTFTAIDNRTYDGTQYDIAVRLVSMGNFHRAITLTGAMCVAVGVKVPNTLLNTICNGDGTTTIGNPSGLLPVESDVTGEGPGAHAASATTYRTQRRIMEGAVLFPQDV